MHLLSAGSSLWMSPDGGMLAIPPPGSPGAPRPALPLVEGRPALPLVSAPWARGALGGMPPLGQQYAGQPVMYPLNYPMYYPHHPR